MKNVELAELLINVASALFGFLVSKLRRSK